MSIFRQSSWGRGMFALLTSAVTLVLVLAPLAARGKAITTAANQSVSNGTSVFWVHNFQFFAGDYRIGATLQRTSEHGEFFVENAIVLSLAQDASARIVYAGTAHGGVFRRAYSDTSWTRVSAGLPNDPDREGKSAVNALVVTGSGDIIAGTDLGIYSFDSAAEVWQSRGIGVTVLDILVNADTLYAAVGGYVWRDDDDEDGDIDVSMGVRRSIDQGQSWSNFSAGLPKDDDGDYVEIYSLAKTAGAVHAATPGGVFQLTAGTDTWRGVERGLLVASPQITVKLSESTRDEAQKGGDVFRDYYRWLTVDPADVFPETDLILTFFGDEPADDKDTISQWLTPLESGILGDAGKLMLELGSITGLYNVSFSYVGYDTAITISDFQFQNEDSVATIINPLEEAMLLVSDARDPEYEPGGQYATIQYDNGVDSYIWSARIEALREPNKDLRGVILSEATRIAGDKPDYYQLNDPLEVGNFSATTIDKANIFSRISSSADGDSLVGYSGDVNTLVFDGDLLYAGGAGGVAAVDLATQAWTALPFLLPFTPIPVYSLEIVDGDLVAGSGFGYFEYSVSDTTWTPINKDLMSYITNDEIDALVEYLDSSTPIDSTKGIYDILTGNFSVDRLPDIDHSAKIGILLHDIHDISETWNGSSNGSEGGIDQIHGYIRPLDQGLIGRTNLRDMTYVTTKGATNAERGAAIAHQLVSLMMLNQDVDEERWISEGIAFFGEKMCGFDMPTAWSDFAQASSVGLPLVAGTRTIGWGVNPNGGSAVGELHTKAAMWITYLYENLGGIAFIKALMDEQANGIAGIEVLMESAAFRPAGVSDLLFGDLFSAWSIAYTINDTNLIEPGTKLRDGYLEPGYHAMIKTFQSGQIDRLGVRAVPMQPDESLEEYNKLIQPLLYQNGINSWATVYRSFFIQAATGGPKKWAGKKFHMNAVDWGTVAVWILKHKSTGGFEVIHMTDEIDAQNELIFDVFAEFGANADTSEYIYDKVFVGLSNQNPESRGIRTVLSTDVTFPIVELNVVHNAVYPEFVSFFFWSDERIRADVDIAENPVVTVVYADGREEPAEVSLFQEDDGSSAGQGSIYSGGLQLEGGQSFMLRLSQIMDIAGNEAPPESLVVAVSKEIANTPQTIKSPDGRLSLLLPADVPGNIPYVTISAASPAITNIIGGANLESLHNAIHLYNIGPGGARLQGDGMITVNLDADAVRMPNLGLYRVWEGGLEPVPSSFNPVTGDISAQISVLGTYLVVQDAALPAETAAIPERYQLAQNYPNPFNPATTISFGLPTAGNTRLVVFDIRGRNVQTLVDGYYEPGVYKVVWDGKDGRGTAVGSGVYFFSIQSKGFTTTRKMILIK